MGRTLNASNTYMTHTYDVLQLACLTSRSGIPRTPQRRCGLPVVSANGPAMENLEARTLMSVVTTVDQLLPNAQGYGGTSQFYSGTITIDDKPITSGGMMILLTNSTSNLIGGLQNNPLDDLMPINYVGGFINQDDATFWGLLPGQTITSINGYAPMIWDKNGDGFGTINSPGDLVSWVLGSDDVVYSQICSISQTPFAPGTQGTINIDYTVFLPGDANKDGTVAFADYQALEAGFGNPGNWSTGDFNADGQVTFADYQILEANFGKTSVPEPATLALVALGGLRLAQISKKRWKQTLRQTT